MIRRRSPAEFEQGLGLWRRMTLRRADGGVYLDRWGFSHPRLGGVLLHRMNAPDPGPDLHDHPWWFVTIPLRGGYLELRAKTVDASGWAFRGSRGRSGRLRPWHPRVMRLDECHTITALTGRAGRPSWSLVVNGPRRRSWGFYTPDGWVPHDEYGGERRGGLTTEWGRWTGPRA